MATADRLSVLPDDVLLRVLSFAPAREAAASGILSRRWRSLWRRTSAVNLDSRPYAKAEQELCSSYPLTFYAFFRDARAALAAFRPRCGGTGGLKRLTLFLEEGAYYFSDSPNSWYNNPEPKEGSRLAGLLADPAVARLEELSIDCVHIQQRQYSPPLASLPCAATLRVLELTRCRVERPSPGLALPRLTGLTLRECFFLEGYLQVMVNAAPALASLTLVNVGQRAPKPSAKKHFHYYSDSNYSMLPIRLRCRTVTALVVVATYASVQEVKASVSGGSGIGIELDMSNLGFFRYRGYPIKLSLTSPAPGLSRVDFDVTQRHRDAWDLKYEPPSRMLASFSGTRALKLRLSCIEDIVANGGVALPTFPNLKLLKLEAKYEYVNGKTAAATAALLRSCPAMSELLLRLNMKRDLHYESRKQDLVGGTFAQSMERFNRLASLSSAHRDVAQLGGVSEVADAFTNNRAFRCLQASLRKVTLQFKAREVNCFPVQLAKFLAENAMVLEEMHVEDGSQFWPDRLYNKLARWRADAFRRRNLPDTAAGFRVYQLASPVVDSKKEDSFYGYD